MHSKLLNLFEHQMSDLHFRICFFDKVDPKDPGHVYHQEGDCARPEDAEPLDEEQTDRRIAHK